MAALRDYGRDNDLRQGASRRFLALILFMLIIVGGHLLRFTTGPPPAEWTPLAFLGGGAASLGFTFLILFFFRGTFRANRANRSFAMAFVGATLIALCLRVVAVTSGWSYPAVMATEFFIHAYGLVGVSMIVGWHVLFSAAACLAAGIAGAHFPAFVQLTSAAGAAVAIGVIAWGWRREASSEFAGP